MPRLVVSTERRYPTDPGMGHRGVTDSTVVRSDGCLSEAEVAKLQE